MEGQTERGEQENGTWGMSRVGRSQVPVEKWNGGYYYFGTMKIQKKRSKRMKEDVKDTEE